MPNLAPEDYSHLLDRQQKATAEAAAAQGRPFDVRGQALANLVGRFEDPHQALTYLSETSNPLQTRKAQLDAQAVPGAAGLSAAEKTELETINGQLAGTASISADVVREISQAKATRFEEYRNQGVQSLDGLKNTVEGLRISSETAKNQLAAARRMYPTTDPTRAEKLKPFEDAFRMAEVRHKEAEGIYNDMHKQAVARQAREQAKTEKEQAVGRKRQLRGMSLDELGGTVGDLKDDRDRKQKELDDATAAGASDEDKGRIQKELADLTARFNEANDVLSRKKVETAGEIDADLAKQAEELTRQRSSKADLQTGITTRETDLSGFDIGTIHDKILDGQPVSKEELAAYGNDLANQFLEHGRAGINMQQLNTIFAVRPELQQFFADRITQSDQARDFMRQHFPNNWEKVLDFARDHPGWLMLILAILAGTVVGPASLAGAGVNLMKK